MSGYVIRQLKRVDGKDKLAVAMIIEEEDLGKDRGMEPVIIPESSESGTRLWRWAQQEKKRLPLSPSAFGQPAGIKATRLKAHTQAAQNSPNAPIPKDHCIVAVNNEIDVILPNRDLYVV